MSTKKQKGLAALKIGQKLLEQPKRRRVRSRSLLKRVIAKNQALRKADIKKGKQFTMPFESIESMGKKFTKISAKNGTLVKCPTKLERKSKVTRIT
tara:strand:- start:1200 stop:1487 length:288 start_codon:yes stop_codon:yes gene_type:complete